MVEASIYTRVHRGSCLGDERHPLTYVGLGRFQHGMVSVSRDRLLMANDPKRLVM